MSRPASGTQSRKVSCCYVWGLGVPFSKFSFPVLLTRPNTFLTERHVNFNAQKIHPLFCCLDSPDLALLSLSRNAGLPLPALRDREREREGPEMDYFLEGQTVNEFQYNPCINHINITCFKLLNQLPLVLSCLYLRVCTEWELWWLTQHHK